VIWLGKIPDQITKLANQITKERLQSGLAGETTSENLVVTNRSLDISVLAKINTYHHSFLLASKTLLTIYMQAAAHTYIATHIHTYTHAHTHTHTHILKCAYK